MNVDVQRRKLAVLIVMAHGDLSTVVNYVKRSIFLVRPADLILGPLCARGRV